MPVRHVQGVRIDETGNKKWDYDYGPSDVKSLYRRGAWRNWQEEINWLQQYGERDNKLTPGETVALVEDLRSLMQARAPFTSDPMQAFQMAHKYRMENNRKFAREHAEAVQQAREIARSSRRQR
ncbi:MAG: hypothetical protein QME94_13350 [Anaerolineae bacterium]|nr:hypothetical protein [Anaerolineae bacterium]